MKPKNFGAVFLLTLAGFLAIGIVFGLSLLLIGMNINEIVQILLLPILIFSILVGLFAAYYGMAVAHLQEHRIVP